MTVKKNDLSWIVVGNLAQSISFFTKHLGLTVTDHNPDFGWAELSSPENGARLGIAEAKKTQDMRPGTNAVMTYSVDNIEQAAARFKTDGVTLQGEMIVIPGIVKMQTFLDPDGNTFQLVEELEGK